MRILHIGSGLRPWRRGGLVAYAEDLMAEQVRRGHTVSYFFAGRQYPLARPPRLRRWSAGAVEYIELRDSPLYDHGRQPEAEISEPHTEGLLRGVLTEQRPEVAHVHELAGLPLSMLGILADAGVPAVFTLQDYFPLCPAFRLLDAAGQRCRRTEVGADCAATLAADPRPAGLLIEATVAHHLGRSWPARQIGVERSRPAVLAAARLAGAAEAARRRGRAGSALPDPAEGYQRRREAALRALDRVPVLVAMSTRVREIYAELGVGPERLRTVPLTLRHIAELPPTPRSPARPLRFATLSGFESAAKGAELLLDAVQRLIEAGRGEAFRLQAIGYIAPEYRARLAGLAPVQPIGEYLPERLPSLLADVDVGLVTSVWEEAFGFVGLEYLACGVPVLANALGGMLDYVWEEETGWLNHTLNGAGLAQVMSDLLDEPSRVAEVSRRAIGHRGELIRTIGEHAGEMEALYREAGTLAAAA